MVRGWGGGRHLSAEGLTLAAEPAVTVALSGTSWSQHESQHAFMSLELRAGYQFSGTRMGLPGDCPSAWLEHDAIEAILGDDLYADLELYTEHAPED